jgi:hypothetical protein
MSKYTEFDAALIAQISVGRNKMVLLNSYSSGLRVSAMPFRNIDSLRPTDAFRVIDRRLQYLRKAGKIRFSAGAWEVLA